MSKKEKSWILFDGRYLTDPESASCYEVCLTLQEAMSNAADYGDDTVVVEVTSQEGKVVKQKIVKK